MGPVNAEFGQLARNEDFCISLSKTMFNTDDKLNTCISYKESF